MEPRECPSRLLHEDLVVIKPGKTNSTLFNKYHYDANLMHYPTFTVEDFCKDPDFIRWVIAPTDESNRFWRAFMVDNPHKVADVQTATAYVKTIHFDEINPSPHDLARLKQRIWEGIEQPVRVRGPQPQRPVRRSGTGPVREIQWYRRPYWAAAAVVLLVASMGIGWWAYQTRADLTYETVYGKIQEIRLADGSVVTLNANSSLRVSDNLDDAPIREVWLDGEAYFDIAKRTGAKFIVHTDEANVEVLGTEFNVNTRRQQTNVVLHEGKVQLSTGSQSTVMKPGDMAIVTPKSRSIQLKRVQPDVYDTWKASYIILDNKSLPEIINVLEDTFGITIKLEDAGLANKKLTGRLRTVVAEDCLENLAIIVEADVTKAGDTYLFR